jgi:DNA-directed RNA polymerase subunit RPC12/RpoP
MENTKTKTTRVLQKRTRPRCPDCGFRIRGKDHENGMHHNKRVPQCRKR